jgi:hypothetical protein
MDSKEGDKTKQVIRTDASATIIAPPYSQALAYADVHPNETFVAVRLLN